MPIQTKRIYDAPSPSDGHRLLVMRVWPRGVRKDRVDAWDRGLAPSTELLADYRAKTIDWPGAAMLTPIKRSSSSRPTAMMPPFLGRP